MKINNVFKVLLLLISFSFVSCNFENVPDQKGVKETWLENNRAQSASRTSIEVLSNNRPVSGVSVKRAGEIIGETNSDGMLSLENLRLQVGDVLNFEHNDYVTVTKVINRSPGLQVILKKRARAVRISSSRTAEVRLDRGGSIKVPKFAFSRNGRAYRGDVNIRATYIDVTNSIDLVSAPGSYIAQNPDRPRDMQPLTSFGMVEINATVPNTNVELDLIPTKPIKIELPVISSDTPSTVNLYAFNEDTGYWNLESALENSGSMLIGEVTSIDSSWNADEPCAEDLICVVVQVEFADGNPGCAIYAIGETYLGSDGGYVPDANGFVEFQVCPNSVFTLASCLVPCCDGQPENEICCDFPYAYYTTIDMSSIPINPDGCTDIGFWLIEN